MPYPLDGEESESSEPTTPQTTQERAALAVSVADGIRRLQEDLNRVSHAALNVQDPRVRSSDMAQEVAETAREASLRAIPSMEDAIRYATREVTPARPSFSEAEIMARLDARYERERQRFERSPLTFISTPASPSFLGDLMRPGALPVVRRGPGSPLHSRPFRELLMEAIDKARASLDRWGSSDIEITEEDKLEELAERRVDAAIHKELMQAMKRELEWTQSKLTQAVVVMNNLTLDAILREVTLTDTQRRQIEGMKYEH